MQGNSLEHGPCWLQEGMVKAVLESLTDLLHKTLPFIILQMAAIGEVKVQITALPGQGQQMMSGLQ